MNVSLTPQLEELVRSKVESGRYGSASEVMREALRLLEERDRVQILRHEALKAEIQKGLASGVATPLDMAAGGRALPCGPGAALKGQQGV